jgi:O-acetyl-ADP-ribose deacetylase (regulator of RNase III)
MKIEIINGDITTLKVDAIVNAANKELSHGGGVCGAIHDQAGPMLAKECERLSRRLGGVLPGEAFITGGYELPARHVIHTLGPVWRGGSAKEQTQLQEELADCYTNSLAVAEEHELASVAFPSVGTGAFGWDKKMAAQISIPAVLGHKARHLNRVILCCHRDAVEEQMLQSILDAEQRGDGVH